MKHEDSIPGVDTKSVIVALTDGIGVPLGRAARSSYFELIRRLAGNERFNRLDPTGRQQVADVLALSIFYGQVVAPLESGRSLLRLAHGAQAQEVRIGRDKLSKKFSDRIGGCVAAFQRILRAQRIPKEVLSFAKLDNFINNVMSAREKAKRETLD